jgi:hypothetical protein
MKKAALILALASALFSCSRSVTPYQAANHHYNGCRPIR